jgi:hypothetical protein
MATNITAGNATNGAAISSDNTGTLAIKTGTGAGTTAISIDASQNVTIPGTLTIAGQPAGGNYAMNAYVAPSTWTKLTGLKAIKVTVVGGGGTGGTSASGSGTFAAGGGGGGAAIEYIPAPSIPGPVAVTAGAGTNSFGAFCSATAGTNATPGPNQNGAAGGTGTGGTFNTTGGGGGSSTSGSTGYGGPSILGGGASSRTTAGAGLAGGNYGGGGSGGYSFSPGAQPGGAGAPGIVIVEEFY